MRTMTVEDNGPFREMFKSRLLSEFPSMQIIEAANEEEVFKGLASYPIDIVFMDIRLPGGNGLDLSRKVKEKYKDLAINILTNYDLPEYREAAARYGANGFIVKDSMKWDQISAMVKCFQRAKDSLGFKPSCISLASGGSRNGPNGDPMV